MVGNRSPFKPCATEAIPNVKKVLEPNVAAGDEVLILTDTDHDERTWKVLVSALSDLGAEPILSLFEPRDMDYYDPPESVARQLKEVDLGVTCTSTAMLHSPAVHEAMGEAEVPIIAMDGGVTLEMLNGGAAGADYDRVEEIEYRIATDVFEGGSSARITSEHGTDLTLSIEDRVFPPREPDQSTNTLEAYEKRPGLIAAVFPRGEFNVPPDPSTANGTIVIDTTMHTLGRLDDPIELQIDAGEIVDISGGYEAQRLESILEEYGDEDAYKMPTEFSVGGNPSARVVGNQREDKTILGSVHFGLGTNADVGGNVTSKLHMDGVILRPTVEIDGEIRIDHGKILPLS